MDTEKVKKSLYKRIWFIVPIGIVVLSIFFNVIGADDTEDQGATFAEEPKASTPVVSLTGPYVIEQVASHASDELANLGFPYVTAQDESAEAPEYLAPEQ